MSETPERMRVAKCYPFKEPDDFYVCNPRLEHPASIKYICADRIEELEAKLAKAVDGLRQCEAEIDDYIRHEYPGDHPVQARYRKRDFDANPARTTLAELTGGKDE